MGTRTGVGLVVGLVVGVIGSHHKLVTGSRSPCKTRCCLFQMLHEVLVNFGVHPAWQSMLMEMSDE